VDHNQRSGGGGAARKDILLDVLIELLGQRAGE